MFSFRATHKIHKRLLDVTTVKGKKIHLELFFSFFFCILEQKEIAIRLYKEGILELERGINIDVWQGHGEKWVKAQRLHDKMQTNLAMAKDRLHFLGELNISRALWMCKLT